MKMSKTLWIAIAYVVYVVLFWFIGTDLHKKMTPAEAFFGMAALAGLFYAGLKFVEKILEGSKPK